LRLFLLSMNCLRVRCTNVARSAGVRCLGIALGATLGLSGCGSSGSGTSSSPPSAPGITSLSPSSGAVGAAVTITGTNFGTAQGTSSVTFNGIAATPTSWNATSIVVTVPAGATTGNVVVAVNDLPSPGAAFTVLPTPSISSLSPSSAAVGAPVTITGANFGATQGTSVVTVNGTAATATGWSAASITASVPAGATTGNVVVTASGVASAGAAFTVVPVSITPQLAEVVVTTQTQQYTPWVTSGGGITWSVDGVAGGDATVGTISATGLYTPPATAGTHSVTATSVANSANSASATVAVTDLAGVFTHHNDLSRDGANTQEYAL